VAGDYFYGAIHDGASLWCAFGWDYGTPGEVLIFTATSADGTWTDRRAVHAAVNDGLRCGCYEATSGRFIFGLIGTNFVGYTTDPTSSAITKVATTILPSAIATDGNQNVVIISKTGAVELSTDAGATWSGAFTPVSMDTPSVQAAVWDSVNGKFLYAGRRASDHALVVMSSATGADGTWAEYVVDTAPLDGSSEVHVVAVGSRGEVLVAGRALNSGGPMLHGITDLDDGMWVQLSYPLVDGTAAGSDAFVGLCQKQQGTHEKHHFWVGVVAAPNDTSGENVARTSPNMV